MLSFAFEAFLDYDELPAANTREKGPASVLDLLPSSHELVEVVVDCMEQLAELFKLLDGKGDEANQGRDGRVGQRHENLSPVCL